MADILSKKWKYIIKINVSGIFFSKDGIYDFSLLKNILQFPSIGLFENLGVDIRNEKEVIKNYIKVQESFNKKILFNF